MTEADYQTLSSVIADGIKKHTAPLIQRIADLEARPALHDKGLWSPGITYDEGAVVTSGGSAWVCTRMHFSVGSDLDHTAFRLIVQKGRDGRDRR